MGVKVSVIIPAYNAEAWLAGAVRSVTAQTSGDWECIIVDDGSRDGTLAVARSLAAEDSRIRVLALDNGGVVRARNRGVAASEGEYLLFLDADDELAPDAIACLIPALESSPDVKIACGLVERFGKGIRPERMPAGDLSMEGMIAANAIPVTALVRRSDFDRAGGFRTEMEAGLEDWDLWLSVLEDGGCAVRVDSVVLRYRVRPGSRNRQIPDETLRALRRAIWERHKPLYSKYFLDPFRSVEYARADYHRRKYARSPGVRLYLWLSRLFHRLFRL